MYILCLYFFKKNLTFMDVNGLTYYYSFFKKGDFLCISYLLKLVGKLWNLKKLRKYSLHGKKYSKNKENYQMIFWNFSLNIHYKPLISEFIFFSLQTSMWKDWQQHRMRTIFNCYNPKVKNKYIHPSLDLVNLNLVKYSI